MESANFLARGRPFAKTSDLQKLGTTEKLDHELNSWVVVVRLLPYWVKCRDPTVVGERFQRKIVIMWFRSVDFMETNPADDWFLFRQSAYDPGEIVDGEPLGLVDGVKKEIVKVLESIPEGARPKQVGLLYTGRFHYLHGRVSKKGDASEKIENGIKQHCQNCCRTACKQLVPWLDIVEHPGSEETVHTLSEEVLAWIHNNYVDTAEMLANGDRPSFLGAFAQENQIPVLPEMNFFLSPVPARRIRECVKLTAGSEEELALKKTVWTAFRIEKVLEETLETGQVPFTAALLEETLGQTPVLFLFKDAGDAWWVEEKLSSWNGPCEQFNDYLSEDGAVRFKMCLPKVHATEEATDRGGSGTKLSHDAFEGIPLNDIDFFSLGMRKDQGVEESSSKPISAVPEISVLSPAAHGETYKPTPMDHAQRVIKRSQCTARDVVAALNVVKYVESQVSQGSPSLVPIARNPSTRCCGWCSRPKERPSRCSACKAVSYCCKDHQNSAWKEHKRQCKELKQHIQELSDNTPIFRTENSLSSGRSALLAVKEGIMRAQHLNALALAGKRRLNIHVTDLKDLNSFIEATVRDPAPILNCIWSVPVYLTVVGEGDDYSRLHNNVYFADDMLAMKTATKSGVLGDLWYEGNNALTSGEKPALSVRVVNQKYNHYFDAISSLQQEQPDIYLSIGSEKPQGLNFFSASTHLLVEKIQGRIPIFFFLPSRLAVRKTVEALSSPLLAEKRSAHGCKFLDCELRDAKTLWGPEVILDFASESIPEVPQFLNAFVFAIVPV